MKVARNAPCPCGSGKKYKRCHMGEDHPETTGSRRSRAAMVAVGGLVVAAIVTATVDLSTGAVVAAGAVVGAAALASLGDPPPPKGGPSNPAGMNFGR